MGGLLTENPGLKSETWGTRWEGFFQLGCFAFDVLADIIGSLPVSA